MTLKQLLAEGRLKAHRTSPKEVQDLLRVADRDLKDASVVAISLDRRLSPLTRVFTEGLLREVKKFRSIVLSWLKAHHARLLAK